MLIWAFCFFCLFISLKLLGKDLTALSGSLGVGRQRKKLESVTAVFRELEETLMAGLVPSAEKWGNLNSLSSPWGCLAADSVRELRACGGSLLPTLQRLRALAEEQIVALMDASAKASQALTQALACGILVPVLGGALYMILPGIEQRKWIWLMACGLALILTAIGAFWLLHLAEVARWGGIHIEHRSWLLSSQCAGERFLALIRAGTPPDLAWVKSCEFLSQDSKTLAMAWGHSVWEMPQNTLKGRTEQTIVGVGNSIRKAVQVSLMEGRPCSERIESILFGLRQDLKALVERELSLLGTRALKPLFVCVAPAILGLLACGLWIAMMDSWSGMEGSENVF